MKVGKLLVVSVIVWPSILVFAAISPCNEILRHFAGFKTTPSWCQYAGKVSVHGMDPVDGEDEIGVFVSDGSGGEILIGGCTMGNDHDFPGYYSMYVYADDPTTIGVKDGAYHDEGLIFKFWDRSEDQEYAIPSVHPYMVYVPDADGYLIQPHVPPIWENGTIQGLGLLNLSAPVSPGDFDGSGEVDLVDAILALQILTKTRVNGRIHLDADVNGDGWIGLADAIHILQIVVNSNPPVASHDAR